MAVALGAELDRRELNLNQQMAAVIDFGPNDKFLSALPMYHSYGLTACTLMPLLYCTREYLYTTPLRYHVIPELAYSRSCTYLFGTSTFLGHYARQAHSYDFARTRVVVSGAERLNPDVAQLWLNRFGLRIMEGYGATECAPVLSLNTPLSYKPGTVGRFLPGIDHCLVPVPGIARGGLLHVRGNGRERDAAALLAPAAGHLADELLVVGPANDLSLALEDPIQLAAVEPDAAALRAHVDRHAAAFTLVQNTALTTGASHGGAP